MRRLAGCGAVRSGAASLVLAASLLAACPVVATGLPAATVRVGSEFDYPPFALVHPDGSPDGFTVDLWKAVAREIALPFTIEVAPFHAILDDFEAGRLDVIINLARSEARDRIADFSVPHVQTSGAIFVRRGERRITTEDDLAGRAIVVLKGDLAHDYALRRGWSDTLVPVDDVATGFRELSTGRHDALLVAKLVGLQTIRQLGISNVVPVGPPLSGFVQKFAFAVRPGNAELLASLNEGLALVKAKGEYDALYERWFGVLDPKPFPMERLVAMFGLGLGVLAFVLAAYARQRHLIGQLTRQTRTLHESEERFRATFEQAAVGIAHVTPEGRFLRVNQRLCDIVGYPRQDLLGLRFQDITHPDDLEADLALVHRLLQAEIPRFTVEKRYVRRSGEVVWADLTVALTRDGAGVPDYFISVVEDTTARKEAEQAQRDADDHLRRSNRALLEVARSAPLYGGQVEACIRQITEVAARGLRVARVSVGRYDRTHSRVRTIDHFDAVHDRHVAGPEIETAGFPNYFGALKRDGIVSAPDAYHDPRMREIAETYLRPRGITSVLDVAPAPRGTAAGIVRFEHVGPPRRWTPEEEMLARSVADLVALAFEIGERHRAEEELRESLSMLNATLNSTADGLLVVDRAGKVVGFNETFMTLWRIPSPLMAMRNDQMLLDFVLEQVADPAAFAAKVQEHYAHPDEVSFDVVECKDGRIVERYSRPQLLDGVLVGRVWSFRDVTERRRVEEANHRLEAQLAQVQKMEALGTLAGGIAHDFNNILAGMLGHAELAMLDVEPGHPAQAALAEILRAIRRARNTVQQILAFSREQPTERRPIHLGPVIQEALGLLRVSLPASIELRCALPAKEPVVLADASQIHQVVLNLCTNAVHAMRDSGGVLAIGLERVVVDRRFAVAHPPLRPGAYACLTVRDTGRGMDDATLGRIFEPFFTAGPKPGTGLGLAVVHGIVETHEGAVVAGSRPRGGTVLRVYLPVVDVAADETGDRRDDLRRGAGEEILVVDDEPSIVQAATLILQRLGYRVNGYTDPEDALRAFNVDPRRFALALTDLTMPRLSGTDLARELRAVRPDLPIILTTGYGRDIPAAARALGCRDMLAKPFHIHTMAEAIANALRDVVRGRGARDAVVFAPGDGPRPADAAAPDTAPFTGAEGVRAGGNPAR